MYSAQLLDHFQNPRNPGELPDADAIAEIENPVCGDVLRLTLKIKSGRIAEIRFKAKGCVPSMACASALTELVAGQTLDESRCPQARHSDRGGGRLAAGFDARRAIGFGCAAGSPEPTPTKSASALKSCPAHTLPDASHVCSRAPPSSSTAIGELGRVVACTRYCADVVPEVADGSRIILADSWTADTAQIVAAQPDLVIAAVPYQEKAVSEILKAGARFLGLAPKTLADIYTDIATIAGAVGALDRGEEVIAAMQREIERSARAEPLQLRGPESGARNGASQSSLRKPGSRNWSRPLAGISWALLAARPRPRKCDGSIRK